MIKRHKEVEDVFKDEDIGLYHDGTTHCGESFAVVGRTVKENFDIIERALKVHWFRGSMCNTEITASLINTLMPFKIPLTRTLAIGNDDASPNGCNYDNLEHIMPYADEEKCAPHTGNHSGEAVETPIMDEFLKDYNVMMGSSNYARVYYKQTMGHTPKVCHTKVLLYKGIIDKGIIHAKVLLDKLKGIVRN